MDGMAEYLETIFKGCACATVIIFIVAAIIAFLLGRWIG